jgi:uncharacterized protein YjbI with pentapeptide repeats
VADALQLELIRRGLVPFNSWRETNPSARIDLTDGDIRKRYLRRAQFSYATLDRANLSECDLSAADFTNASARDANFKSAVLTRTNFEAARLDRANLTNVTLKQVYIQPTLIAEGQTMVTPNASFREARLGEARMVDCIFRKISFAHADFRRASIEGCVFDAVDLDGANFAGATLGNTSFINVDLNRVLGLADVRHGAANSLDLHTLRASRLNAAFLRGAGLSDFEVSFAELYEPTLSSERVLDKIYLMFDARTTKPIQVRQVFISYAREDDTFAAKLERKLSDSGMRSWRDVHDLNAGRVESQIDAAIRLNPILILVLSEHSVDSDWVEWEATRARDIERELKRDVLCPVALDRSWEDSRWSAVLQQQVKKYNILDFAEWRDDIFFAHVFAKLRRGLLLNYPE